MALNIKDEETVRLAAEVAEMSGETETEAIRTALRERRDRLTAGKRRPKALRKYSSMHEWLENEIWPLIPEEERGRPPLTKAEIAELLGYGPEEY